MDYEHNDESVSGNCTWHSCALPLSDGTNLDMSWAVQSSEEDESRKTVLFFTAKLMSMDKGVFTQTPFK